MDQTLSPHSDSIRPDRPRSAYLLLSLLLATIALIAYVWWPMLEEYLGAWDPRLPWWAQVDWLLLGIFGAMTFLIMVGADLRRDAVIVAVGLAGGLIIESWGTQTGLWFYYTAERPPLWIIPAWPVASLAIDRLSRAAERPLSRLDHRQTAALYVLLFGAFAGLLLTFVWPTRHFSLTVTAVILCGFLIATPVRMRTALAVFFAGAALGYFLELWGTTRACWTYYTFETPPAFAVAAHGMAAVAFWRCGLALTAVWQRHAPHQFRTRRATGPPGTNPVRRPPGAPGEVAYAAVDNAGVSPGLEGPFSGRLTGEG